MVTRPSQHRERELFDVVLGLTVAAHGLHVELLEALLEPFERGRVGAEHPFEQRGEEGGPVDDAGVTRPGSSIANSCSTGTGRSCAVITQFLPTTHSTPTAPIAELSVSRRA